MASELCKACDAGRNCLNGRYCPARKQYVEHQAISECNERFRNKGEEQSVLPGTPGTDPQSHERVAKEKPGKYRAYQKEYWSKHYRNYGTKNRVADRAMRERKKPDVEKALSMFKNPQQAAHLAWLLENKRIIGREFNNRVFNQRGQKGMAPYQNK